MLTLSVYVFPHCTCISTRLHQSCGLRRSKHNGLSSGALAAEPGSIWSLTLCAVQCSLVVVHIEYPSRSLPCGVRTMTALEYIAGLMGPKSRQLARTCDECRYRYMSRVAASGLVRQALQECVQRVVKVNRTIHLILRQFECNALGTGRTGQLCNARTSPNTSLSCSIVSGSWLPWLVSWSAPHNCEVLLVYRPSQHRHKLVLNGGVPGFPGCLQLAD